MAFNFETVASSFSILNGAASFIALPVSLTAGALL